MRIPGLICRHRCQSDSLLVVRGHVSDEGPVDVGRAAEPRKLTVGEGDGRKRAQGKQSCRRAGEPKLEKAVLPGYWTIHAGRTQPRIERIHRGRGEVNQKSDPIRLLEREDGLPEREEWHQHQPLEGRRENSPGNCDEQQGDRPEACRPSAQDTEEDQRPGKIGPLVKGDADDDGGGRWFRTKRPIAGRDRRDRHPIHRSVAPDPGSCQLADECRECAADQAQIDRGLPPLEQRRFAAVDRAQRPAPL